MLEAIIDWWFKNLDEPCDMGLTETQIEILADDHFILEL